MPKKKPNIKEILAANLRENRRKKGLTQEKLAEKADISLRYLAMLELGKSFPSGEMLEKLAKALEIEAIKLFDVSSNQETGLQQLEHSLISNIRQVVKEAVKETLDDEKNQKNGTRRQPAAKKPKP